MVSFISPQEHIILLKKKNLKCHSCSTGKSLADDTDMPRHCVGESRPLEKDSPNRRILLFLFQSGSFFSMKVNTFLQAGFLFASLHG